MKNIKKDSDYQLRIYPDFVLRGKSFPVNDVDGSVQHLMKGMAEVMYHYQGIGLAAPQVGVQQRVIVVDTGEGLITLANPEILQNAGETFMEEGCLSLPDVTVEITRRKSVFVQGIDIQGKLVKQEFKELTARVIQHEIDHLNGVLIIDYASKEEKNLLNTKLSQLGKGSGNYQKF